MAIDNNDEDANGFRDHARRSRKATVAIAARRMFASRKAKVAIAAYLVAVLFAVGFIVARMAGQSLSIALGAALVVAGPPAIALIGDRITSIKLGGVGEIALAAASVPVVETVPSDELNNLHPILSSSSGVGLDSGVGPDSGEGLVSGVRKLIEATDSQLLEVDLRDGSYWWPTRLFLLAALLKDFTDVRRLVFVLHAREGREYLGMATPSGVCRCIELALPGVKAAYAVARESAFVDLMSGHTSPTQFAAQPPVMPYPPVAPTVDDLRVVEFTAAKWPDAVYRFRQVKEWDVEQRVSRPWLAKTLGGELRWAAIRFDGSPLSPLLQYRVITSSEDFTALVTDRRLIRVVGKFRLATSIATVYLSWQLRSSV